MIHREIKQLVDFPAFVDSGANQLSWGIMTRLTAHMLAIAQIAFCWLDCVEALSEDVSSGNPERRPSQ
jgi:hypothetical protein